MIVTVISGVLVFVLGEILRDIWLTPLLQYKSLKQEIAYILSFYAQFYSNPIDFNTNENTKSKYIEASNKIREVSAKLSGFIETLTIIKIGIPNKEKLLDASGCLMGISNSMFTTKNIDKDLDPIRNNIIYKNKIIVDLKLCGYKDSQKILDKWEK